MSRILQCKSDSDFTLIKIILEGHDFTCEDMGDNNLSFQDTSNLFFHLGEKIKDLPKLQLEEGRNDVLSIFVPFTMLDIHSIGEYIGELERLQNILTDIAVQADEAYVTKTYHTYRR